MVTTTDMQWIHGGTGTHGDDHHYPEERPARTVTVPGFWLDTHPVTNAQFAEFVRVTGYVTEAERSGGNVFVPSTVPVDLGQPELWWRHDPRAMWRCPNGRDPLTDEHADHPVVQVTQVDAIAYADWVGSRLPTEAEWEWACGTDPLLPTWPLAADGMLLANVWLGEFPWRYVRRGRAGTSPVGAFPSRTNDLFDMLGNVWEWTSDAWTPRHDVAAASSPCCNTTGSDLEVVKGGSFLCATNYCARYRPAARHAQPRGEPACHIGFRCAR